MNDKEYRDQKTQEFKPEINAYYIIELWVESDITEIVSFCDNKTSLYSACRQLKMASQAVAGVFSLYRWTDEIDENTGEIRYIKIQTCHDGYSAGGVAEKYFNAYELRDRYAEDL